MDENIWASRVPRSRSSRGARLQARAGEWRKTFGDKDLIGQPAAARQTYVCRAASEASEAGGGKQLGEEKFNWWKLYGDGNIWGRKDLIG